MNKNAIEESLTHKVVKDNVLIQRAQSNLTRTEQKLINYMISMIEPTDADFKVYRIKVADFAQLVGIDMRHAYSLFIEMSESLLKKIFWIKDGERTTAVQWVMKPEYLEKQGVMQLRLDPDIKKYLIGLKKDFTEYDLFNILSLKTKYAITIYEFMKSYQYKKNVEIEVSKFVDFIASDVQSYKSFGIFKQRVLDPALDDINLNTDMNISYKCLDLHKNEMKTLRGKKVSFLRFRINGKKTMDSFEVYQKIKDRVLKYETSDQVPHQISFDTDNETTALFDDTTNQQVN